jgi:N-methylhydantoinase B
MIIPTVVDTIIRAVAPAMPDRVPAAHHGTLGGAIVFFGTDPKTKRRFVVQSIEGGGWGGRPHEDGESATVSVCQGDVRNGSIEGIELKCPVIVEGRALRRDSGGAGKFRGGLGIDVHVRSLVQGQWRMPQFRGRKAPPWGLWGGATGEPPAYLFRKSGNDEFTPTEANGVPGPAESEMLIRTGGGGGWGNPAERDPQLVREDVIEGLVSREAARERYGVALTDDLSLDAAATQALRKAAAS